MLAWLRDNVSTLVLAIILALTAWVAAVGQADPIIEQSFPEPIEIEYKGLQDGLTIVGDIPQTSEITLRAPTSIWRILSSDDIQLVVDLSDVEAGSHRLEIHSNINARVSQMTALNPAVVPLTIEPLATKIIDVQVLLKGEPAADYRAEGATLDIEQTKIVGPTSAVDQVVGAQVEVDLTNRQQSIDQEFILVPVDEAGEQVSDLLLEHESVHITIPITRIENIRRLVVIPNVEGQEALAQIGYYRVTRIAVTPLEVAVFSDDAQALEALPSFIDTLPIDVTNRTTSVDQSVALNLPEGFSLIGEQSVRVVVSIEPIVKTLSIIRKVEIQSVMLGLYSYVSPEDVSLILSGPAINLDSLQAEDVRVIVDVLDLSQGTYQLEPEVIVLPDDITWEPPNPAIIEVVLTFSPRPSATPNP